MNDRVQLVRDGAQPVPGVTVLATPGHTPGHVSYRVEGKDNDMLFAGDAVKNRYELRTGEVDSTLDRAASERSVLLLRQHLTDSDVVLVPGHDVPLRVVGEQVAALEPQDCEVTVFLGDGGEPSTRTLVP